jgi:hypothetical protein
MLRVKGLSLLSLFAGVALAWKPSMDPELAQRIVDGAYSRLPKVQVFWEQGVDTLSLERGSPGACLPPKGSQPRKVRVGGQGEVIFLLAERARNEFRVISGEEALSAAQRFLPPGHLRVYLEVAGLPALEAREAYTLGAKVKEGYRRAYRVTYLDDWRRGERGWEGTLVFYLDLSDGTVDPQGALSLVFLTESPHDCLYRLTVDLGAFE